MWHARLGHDYRDYRGMNVPFMEELKPELLAPVKPVVNRKKKTQSRDEAEDTAKFFWNIPSMEFFASCVDILARAYSARWIEKKIYWWVRLTWGSPKPTVRDHPRLLNAGLSARPCCCRLRRRSLKRSFQDSGWKPSVSKGRGDMVI